MQTKMTEDNTSSSRVERLPNNFKRHHAKTKTRRRVHKPPQFITCWSTLSLLLISSFVSHGLAFTPARVRVDAHNIGHDLSSILYESNVDLPDIVDIDLQKPPLINKCCQFDSHFELSDNGEGRCVVTNDPEAHNLMETSPPVGKDKYRVWHVPDLASAVSAVIDEEEIESSENITSSSFNNETTSIDPSINDNPESIPKLPVRFQLNVGYPRCSEVEMERMIIPQGQLAHDESFHLPKDENDTLSEEVTVLNVDGSLIWINRGLTHTRGPEDYCIEQLNKTAYIALICKPTCNDLNPCVRKCCPPSQVLDLVNQRCVDAKNPWMPYLYTTSYIPVTVPKSNLSSNDENEFKLHRSRHFQYTNGVPDCEDTYVSSLWEDPEEKMYALVNGSLLTVIKGSRIIHPPDTFCIDGTVNHEVGGEMIIPGPDYEPVYYSGSELDQIAIICYPQEPTEIKESPDNWKYPIIAAFELVTAFFLFLTALSYVILWEQQNIHGWLQFAYVVSLLQSFLCLAVLQLSHKRIKDSSPPLCEAMGSVIHFSFLSAFFWLTSMNFDLWFTFSGCSPLRPSSKIGEIKRFCMFALFSWGSSGVIAGTGLVLDRLYKDDPNSTVIRPHFGENSCYFGGREEQLPYFYAPMGILLAINLLFFFSTIYSLHKLQKDTKFATQQSSKQEKKRFLLFMKLFVVMGVLWIFEVLSWGVQPKIWHYIFFPTDLLNASQGVLIFIIFACKANTCRQIEGQLKKFTLFLQENRDKGFGIGAWNHFRGIFVVTFASITLPIIHLIRIVLNYFGRACGRKTLSDTSGRRTLSNTTTVTTSTFDKSRKVSDCSVTTTVSSVTGGGGTFTNSGGSPGDGHFTSSSNSSSITNIEMDYTSHGSSSRV